MKKFFKKAEVTDALDKASSPVRFIWSRLPEALLGLFSIGIIIFSIVTYFPAVTEFASKLIKGNKYIATLEGFLNPFRNRNALLESGLPVYDLKIKRQQYVLLEQTAQKAVKKGWMNEDLQVWANAQFFHEGQKYNVKVRLRGDLPNHWKNPKKSWRIKFGRQNLTHEGEIFRDRIYFEGKRQINLIIAQDREYILAYFVNSLMNDVGLAAPRDKFVVLRINGVLQGLYYEVEHMDKPLLAAHRRPETTIFGQDDRVMHFEQYTKLGIPTASDARFDIGSMSLSVERDGRLARQAMQVLIDHSLHPTKENFKRVREVLDWKKYLYFRNVTTLCNTNHVRFGSDNLRLYFDASRGLLEPIPWDVHILKLPVEPGTIDFWNSHGPDKIQVATLTNPMLRLERNQLLWEWVADSGRALMKRFDKIYNRMRPYFWQDVLSTPNQAYKMDIVRKYFQYNLKRVHRVLSHSGTNLTYRLESNDRAALEFAIINFSGIKLQNIQISDSLFQLKGEYQLFEDTNNNKKLDEEDKLLKTVAAHEGVINLPFNKYLLPDVKYNGDFIENTYWEFFDTIAGRYRMFLVGKLAPIYKDPLVWNPPAIAVTAQNAVTGKKIPAMFINQEKATPVDCIGITAYDTSAPFDLDAMNYTMGEFLAQHPQFKTSKDHPGAVEISGKVTISKNIIIPKNVPLVLKAGADITMKPRVSILSYGGLYSIGTEKDSIRIHGDGSGIPWGVLAVLRPTDKKVIVKYTRFSDAGQAFLNATLFTGGFAVHDGDLDLTHSRFVKMASEDGMNLKNGHIFMANTIFEDCNADNVDLDFCTGEVRDCIFRRSGINGDGLDVSGAYDLVISGCVFDNLSDKGISVGENSHPTIINCLMRENNIGISCKDLSNPGIANCTFIGNKLAIEAKRKKPFFGGGSGHFVNCVFSGNNKLLEEDYFSAGNIKIEASLADQPTEWQVGPEATIRFANTDRQNYQLESTVSHGNNFNLLFPEWFPKTFNTKDIKYPGIFSASKKDSQVSSPDEK